MDCAVRWHGGTSNQLAIWCVSDVGGWYQLDCFGGKFAALIGDLNDDGLAELVIPSEVWTFRADHTMEPVGYHIIRWAGEYSDGRFVEQPDMLAPAMVQSWVAQGRLR